MLESKGYGKPLRKNMEKNVKDIDPSKNKKNSKSQVIINPVEKQTPLPYKETFLHAMKKHRISIDEKIKVVLNAKAAQNNLPFSVLEQVFLRGIKSLPINSNLTREQHAMNRVNSFLSGGAAMKEDIDLIPILERIVTKQLRGTGGGARPHIRRERSPYNDKIIYHVLDSKGRIKHTANDEMSARRHLIQKYQAYLEGVENPAKRLEGTRSLVKTYSNDTPGENKKIYRASPDPRKSILGEIKTEDNESVAKVKHINELSSELMRRAADKYQDKIDRAKHSSEIDKLGNKKAHMSGQASATERGKRYSDKGLAGPGARQRKMNANEEVEQIDEKNKPTNPGLWSKAKSLARSKFDVYPSAYANGWAAKWYKSKGGSWKSVSEEDMSHQAQTTMKHIEKPTPGEKKAARDIRPGIKGYRDRIAMLHSADARGDLKKEAYYRTNPYGYNRLSGAAAFRRANPDEPDEPSYNTKRSSSYRAPAAKEEPHDVHINGKKWKTFGSQRHAQNVANKIKGATVHKSPQSQQEARKFGYDAINASIKKRTGQSLEDRAKHYAATSERLKKMQADYEAQGIIKKKDEGQGK